MTIAAREIHLKSRPSGLPGLDNFAFASRTLPEPAAGQLLVRTLWMSVDPYMRGRMTDRPSYIAPFAVGEALEGAAIGVVEQSGDEKFKPGDVVSHFSGWRDYALVEASTTLRIDIDAAPDTAWLGPLDIPGFTAWVGLGRIAALKPGETVFVSAGAGAVGSMVVQIARIKGARVIASAGSEEKARWLREELGADAVINYRSAGNLTKALSDAAPDGVDVYFDNVGGTVTDAVIANINFWARVAICGSISQYNSTETELGPRTPGFFVGRRVTTRGFIVSDFMTRFPFAMARLGKWVRSGQLKYREDIVDGGISKAPEAFIGLLKGDNFGKRQVRVGPEPAGLPKF